MLLLRLALLLAAGGAWVLAVGLAHRRAGEAQEVFSCPMHPGINGRGPSPCPLCGMALERPGRTLPVPDDAIVHATSLVVADPIVSPAWRQGDEVRSLLYDDEVLAVRLGETITFEGARLRLAAVTKWDEGTSLLRWTTLGGQAPATGAIDLGARPRELTVLPSAAVVNGPAGPHALVWAHGRLSVRPLVTGRIAYDFVTVVAGLKGDEAMVTPAALYEAERHR